MAQLRREDWEVETLGNDLIDADMYTDRDGRFVSAIDTLARCLGYEGDYAQSFDDKIQEPQDQYLADSNERIMAKLNEVIER